MTVDAVRLRTVDDVVLAFMEPDRELPAADIRRWWEALEQPGISKTLILSVGPIHSEARRRRLTVDLLERKRIRLVAVTEHRLNRGLIGMFSWLGVSITGYPWSRLEDAARDVASRPELVVPILRAARVLRAESPAALGLEPDEG